jgi:hypothetical protein
VWASRVSVRLWRWTADQNLLALRTDEARRLGDLDVLLLSDVLSTAWHATEMGEVREGDTVAIWGAGPGQCRHRSRAEQTPPRRRVLELVIAYACCGGEISHKSCSALGRSLATDPRVVLAVGILAAHCAQHRGAKMVILLDLCQYRLDFARARLDQTKLVTINPTSVPPPFSQTWDVATELRKGKGADVFSVILSCDSDLESGETVLSTLKKQSGGHGPDVCIEAVGFHYAKSWLHRAEMTLMMETDPADVLNEMIGTWMDFHFRDDSGRGLRIGVGTLGLGLWQSRVARAGACPSWACTWAM